MAAEREEAATGGESQGVLQYHHLPGGVSTVLANVSPTERCDGASPACSLGFSAMISLRRTPQGRDKWELSAIIEPMSDGYWLGTVDVSSLTVGAHLSSDGSLLFGVPPTGFSLLVFLTVRC